MNAIVMIGYAVGNAAGPQYWKAKYQKRCVSHASRGPFVMWCVLGVVGGASAPTLRLVFRGMVCVPRLLFRL